MKKALILLAIVLLIPTVANANTLTNSNFETGSVTPWAQIGYHGTAVASAYARSGSYGLRISMESPVQGDGWGGVYQQRTATVGDINSLSGWINTSALSADLANASLQISYFKEAAPTYANTPLAAYNSTPKNGGISGWSQVSVTSNPAPAETQTVRYTLVVWGSPLVPPYGYSGTGAAYFDDVSGDVVPEPSSLLLLGTGIIGMLSATRKRKSA